MTTATAHAPELENDLTDLVPLAYLHSGQRGRVGAVVGGGSLVHRLREMGLRAGVEVQVLRSGSPCIIRMSGHKLCVRSEEMTGVLVRTRPGSAD